MKRIGVVAAVFVAVLSCPAWALECHCFPTIETLPGDGQVGVPRNVVPRLIGAGIVASSLSLRLVGPEGEVPIIAVQRNTNTVEVRPGALLAAHTTYRLVAPSRIFATMEGASVAEVAFTTSDAEDLAPPQTPTIMGARENSSVWIQDVVNQQPCSQWQEFTLQVPDIVDDSTRPLEIALEVAAGPSATALVGGAEGFTVFARWPYLTDVACGANFPTRASKTIWAQVAAVDWAGNVSALSAAQPVKTPSCGGCSASTGNSALWGLGLAMARRRRPGKRSAPASR